MQRTIRQEYLEGDWEEFGMLDTCDGDGDDDMMPLTVHHAAFFNSSNPCFKFLYVS